ncbi:MAG TPA: hypothetical protein VHL80_14585 [Polyangia bacterium]|nr:hypothetical protein [Polyangia bacterium]
MAASDDSRALAPAPVSFGALASAGAALLRSPVSGQPCVYWRVRITQRLTDRSQLVHEIESEEAFELRWGRGDGPHDEVRLWLEPESARIQAPPVLHREGTPGAEAAERYFGLAGPLVVEEVMIRAGEALSAEGIICDLDAAAGPFRGTTRGPELVEALVTVESKSLAPVLLPWALGTAAALMSGMGLATYAAWRAHVLHLPPAVLRLPRLVAPHAQLQRPELPHPRLP